MHVNLVYPNGIHHACHEQQLVMMTPRILCDPTCAAGICGVRAARQGQCAVVLHQDSPALQSHRLPVHLQASQVHV